MKIYSNFLLAKLAIPTATRDSSDSMPGKQSEKTFGPASNPAINQQGKQGERIGQGTYSTQSKGAKPSGKD